ncbi:MAG TPA: LacI family DNA-binding transcriptional regulator [Thermomicrobiales bacterium]|nr:LacI family DNA-binding transcriptional regulator [Thermomicrobiales bacterium]
MATMADIARAANVSVSTVSYALSGKRPISAETRRRVLAALDAADFRPHAAGRALASRRSRTVGLLFPAVGKGVTELQLEFFTSAAETAGEHGYAFILSTAPNDDVEVLRLSRDGLVDGLILMEVRRHDPRVALLRAEGVPFSLIGHCDENDGYPFVDLDFAAALETAVAHLADLGHREIAFVNASAGLIGSGYGPAVRSLAGFEAAIARFGLQGHHFACEPTRDAGQKLTDHLVAEFPGVTAVVSINREALGGVVGRAYELGVAIPADLSVVGILSERLARLFSPPLTTVDFPVAAMARLGTELLIRQLEGGAVDQTQTLFDGALVVRRSSGPAPAVRNSADR